jgi:hypothetical protein
MFLHRFLLIFSCLTTFQCGFCKNADDSELSREVIPHLLFRQQTPEEAFSFVEYLVLCK